MCICIRSYHTKQTVVAVPLFLNNSFSNTFEIPIRMSYHSRKHSTSNRRSTDRDRAPLKRNASQRRRPEELPQRATREIMPLTQEDIPRII